ncbi:MAG: chromosome partitioning protein ParA [Phycisphaerae bacterium]|nr:chromosome partitioning protein ParA [Phycisphaerae bacterium]
MLMPPTWSSPGTLTTMDASVASNPVVVAVLNQKGGVGKTTSVVNVGAGLALAGRRVLLIDLDPQGHLGLHLGVDPDPAAPSAYDVLVDPTTQLDDALVKDVRPGLDVLPSTVDLAGAEVELTNATDPHGQLALKIAAAKRHWDVVILDCPPSLGHLTMNALVAAHEVFVPMQAHFLALQGVGRLLETVGRVVRSVNQQLQVTGIILCMHEKQTTLGREIESDLEQFLESTRGNGQPWSNCRVLRPAIRRNIKLAEAPSFGQSIFDYAPTCPGAVDYRRLAEGLSRDWINAGKLSSPPQVGAAVEVKPNPFAANPSDVMSAPSSTQTDGPTTEAHGQD